MRKLERNDDVKILMITNGRESQTTAILFRALAHKLSERHEVNLRLRPPPGRMSRKVQRVLVPERESLAAVRACDVLVLHTAVALSFQEVFLARTMGKKIVVFLWDVYPESMMYMNEAVANPEIYFFRLLENTCLRRADKVLVPNEDYRLHPAVAALPNVGIFPMWPTNETYLPVKPAIGEGGALRIAFSGQINKIRDLDSACLKLCAAFERPIELHLYSADTFEPAPAVSALMPERLSIVHHGFVSEDVLARELNGMDAGLISLTPDFPLPAFPSKLFAYMQAALPVVYHGPDNPGVSALMSDTGIGLPLARLAPGTAGAMLRSIRENYDERRARFLGVVGLEWERLAQVF